MSNSNTLLIIEGVRAAAQLFILLSSQANIGPEESRLLLDQERERFNARRELSEVR